ncbi:MAG: sigma-54-dependent Fis family transcriptional regulator, partial [Candidatus Hydrogenedentes bacterium]|nr:sigma-54-dependent Fis family transcriptional regulator [Candidatus Hydrogenedentota bacterium]
MHTILIVDDEKNIREGLLRALKPAGYKIILAEDGEDGYKKYLTHKVDLAILDIRMPRLSGLDLLERINKTENPCPVIFLTGHGTVETAVEAMRLGAYDFLTKPVNLDKLELLIQRALNQKQLENTNRALIVRVKEYEIEKIILGKSRAIRAVIEKIKKIAPTKSNVVIYGESGTGKELVCDAIHHLSMEGHPLVKVNCAALSPTL